MTGAKQALSAGGHYEPALTVVFLPACGACGAPHPEARTPPAEAGRCPDCGAQVAAPAPPVQVPAVVTGNTPSSLLARALIGIGRWLFVLAQRL